jgi:hypothetical protein
MDLRSKPRVSKKRLPLAFPAEVWADFAPKQREAYRNAQKVLDAMRQARVFASLAGGASVPDWAGAGLADVTGLSSMKLFEALSALSELGLIAVSSDANANFSEDEAESLLDSKGISQQLFASLVDLLKVELLALPEEHIKVVGPDKAERWVFIARPLSPPEVEPSQLN